MDSLKAPTFSGEDGEDFREWFLDIGSHIKMKSMKPGAACCFLRLCTRKRARHFIDGLQPEVKDDLTALGKALLDEYGNARMRWRAMGKLWALKQKPTQSFADFLVEMEKAATRVGTMSEEEILMAVVFGARPSVRRQLMMADVHKDMKTLREYIKKVDVDSEDDVTAGGEEWRTALRRIEAKMDQMKLPQTTGTQSMDGVWWPEQSSDNQFAVPVQMMETSGGTRTPAWTTSGGNGAGAAAPQRRVWYSRPYAEWSGYNYQRNPGPQQAWSSATQTPWQQQRNQSSYTNWNTGGQQQRQPFAQSQNAYNSGPVDPGWQFNFAAQRAPWRSSGGRGGGGFGPNDGGDRNTTWRGTQSPTRGQYRGGGRPGNGGYAGRGNFRGNYRDQPAQRGFGRQNQEDTRFGRRSSLSASASPFESRSRSPAPEHGNGALYCTICKMYTHNAESCASRNMPRGSRECWD
jgi:hypothetical protein